MLFAADAWMVPVCQCCSTLNSAVFVNLDRHQHVPARNRNVEYIGNPVFVVHLEPFGNPISGQPTDNFCFVSCTRAHAFVSVLYQSTNCGRLWCSRVWALTGAAQWSRFFNEPLGVTKHTSLGVACFFCSQKVLRNCQS